MSLSRHSTSQIWPSSRRSVRGTQDALTLKAISDTWAGPASRAVIFFAIAVASAAFLSIATRGGKGAPASLRAGRALAAGDDATWSIAALS